VIESRVRAHIIDIGDIESEFMVQIVVDEMIEIQEKACEEGNRCAGCGTEEATNGETDDPGIYEVASRSNA
jgi:hypothetical protein